MAEKKTAKNNSNVNQNPQAPPKEQEDIPADSGNEVTETAGKVTKKGFNLIPDRHYKKIKKKERRADVNVYGALAIFIMVAVASGLVALRFYLVNSMEPDREIVAEKWNSVVSMKDVEWQARAISERLDTLSELNQNLDLFNVIKNVESEVSVDFDWESIEINSGYECVIGVETMEDATKILYQLQDSELLGKVQVEGIRTVARENGDGETASSGVTQVYFTVIGDTTDSQDNG